MAQNSQSLDRVWVLVCKGDSCSQKGKPEKIRVLLKQAAREFPAQSIKVSYVSCLGLCGEGPNVLVCRGGRVFQRLDGSESEDILKEVRTVIAGTDA